MIPAAWAWMPSVPTEGEVTGPQRVQLPIGGAASATAYRDQPSRFCPPETVSCIRPFDSAKDRPRFGTTPGIIKLFNQQFGDGNFIQSLDTVSRATVIAGYHLGDASRILGRSVLANPLAGQVFEFQPGATPALEWFYKVDVTGDGGPGTLSVSAVAHHPETDLVAVGTDAYNDTASPGFTVASVFAFDRYGNKVWSTRIARTGLNVFINTVEVTRLYTMVCTNEKVYALRNDTGAVAETTACNAWSDECIEARRWKDTTTGFEYLYVLFNGATALLASEIAAGNQLPNGTAISSGFYAKCFRSGVMKFRIASDSYATTPVFTQIRWGRQLSSGDPFYEADHGYFRISENSEVRPRGAIVNALAVDLGGNVYIARCNCGGGPSVAYTPDLLLARPITVCKVSASAGTMLWEVDTESIIRVGSQAVYNDIPTAGGIEPSVQAIAVDSTNGLVYVGGAPNAANSCVFRLSGSDGSMQWQSALELAGQTPNRTIRQACIAVDPTDGHCVVGGDNSVDWPGALGVHAHLWKLNSVDGSVVWTENLSNTTTSTGVVLFSDGRIVTSGSQV